MNTLYEGISTIASILEEELTHEPYNSLLLSPLLKKWESLSDEDIDLFPLLECISNVAISMGPSFIHYTKPIYDRSLRLIEMVFVNTTLHYQNGSPLPNREFLICSLDIISGLCEALKEAIEPLIINSKLIPLLLEICKNTDPDYTQSGFALVGDIAKNAIRCYTYVVPTLVPVLITGTKSTYYETINNAVWSLGEILKRIQPDVLQSYIENIYNAIIDVFGTTDDLRMLETCVVAIGRLGINYPNILGSNLKLIIHSMCGILKKLPEDTEKSDALRGLCSAVRTNPADILPYFESFCDLLASVKDPSLESLFGSLLHNFKQVINPTEWNAKLDTFRPQTKNNLRKKYQV